MRCDPITVRRMWAFIPIRWPSTPAGDVWTPAQFAALMDPGIVFSLGHYLRRVTYGQADLRYRLFDPLVMDDPRVTMPNVPDVYSGERPDRKPLLNVPRAEITRLHDPDWSTFDRVLFWYAQPTDEFGGGYPPATVMSRGGRFDALCHEVLHGYGFDHTFDGVNEYVSPYDIMSAKAYTLPVPGPTFPRAANPALPTSVADGADQNTTVGPLLSPAQLAGTTYWKAIETAGLVHTLPASLSGPARVRLHAADVAARIWPEVRGPVLVQTTPLGTFGERFTIELRRSGGYDSGFLRADPATAAAEFKPPAGIVVHHRRPDQRLDYVGVLPLANLGDLDATFREYALDFVIRLREIGRQDEWVDIEIQELAPLPAGHGGDLDIQPEDEPRPDGEKVTVWTKPCFAAPRGPYQLTPKYQRRGYRIRATSRGYEKPRYVWRVNGAALDPAATAVTHTIQTKVPDAWGGWIQTMMSVELGYALQPDELRIWCEPTRQRPGGPEAIGNFALPLELVIGESDPGVIKNSYPDSSIFTSLHFTTVALEWDGKYRRAQERCRTMLLEVLRKRIPKHGLPPIPDPPWELVRDRFRRLLAADPDEARAVVADLARALDEPPAVVLAELGASRIRSPWYVVDTPKSNLW